MKLSILEMRHISQPYTYTHAVQLSLLELKHSILELRLISQPYMYTDADESSILKLRHMSQDYIHMPDEYTSIKAALYIYVCTNTIILYIHSTQAQ